MAWLALSEEIASEFDRYSNRRDEVLDELNRRSEYKRAWNEWHREYRRLPEIKAVIRVRARRYFQEIKADPVRYARRKANDRRYQKKHPPDPAKKSEKNRRWYQKKKAQGLTRKMVDGRVFWVHRPGVSTTDLSQSTLSVVNR